MNITPEVEAVSKIAIHGNVTPQHWYQALTFEEDKSGHKKPNFVAVTLLADIVYWYRPTEIRDETTGQVIGRKKKFAGDFLQRGVKDYAEQFGFGQRQTRDALAYLEAKGLIKRHYRTIRWGQSAHNVSSNVLFIQLIPSALEQLQNNHTYGEKQEKQCKNNHTYGAQTPDPLAPSATPPCTDARTYTYTTTDTTTKKNTRDSVAPSFTPEALRLAHLFFQKILENDSKAKKPNFDKWAHEIDKIHKLDKRTWEEIESLINFAQEDEFWRANCLSPTKLRKQFTQLIVKKNKTPTKQANEADTVVENWGEAQRLWSSMPDSSIRVGKTAVEVYDNEGKGHRIYYKENAFIEQVESALRKWGHL